MRGFIFVEFIELVERLHGIEVADELIDSSQLPSGGAYTSVATYPADEMVTLVTRLSEMTDVPVADKVALLFEWLDVDGDGEISKAEWDEGYTRFVTLAHTASEAHAEAVRAPTAHAVRPLCSLCPLCSRSL